MPKRNYRVGDLALLSCGVCSGLVCLTREPHNLAMLHLSTDKHPVHHNLATPNYRLCHATHTSETRHTPQISHATHTVTRLPQNSATQPG
jgi:hypothetical protein